MTKEEWKPVMWRNIAIIPGYYISNHGRILSKKRGKERFLSITHRDRGVGGPGNYSMARIIKPKGLILDEYYGEATKPLPVAVHQLVMWAFKPIDQYPPEIVKNDWDTAPESFKQWVRDTVYIDHIDDNPFNNHVDNLRYVRPIDNNRERKHHGNKSEDTV